MQQIGLYKELLSQVTYQNQLLSRDINYKQQNSSNNVSSNINSLSSIGQPKYSHNEIPFGGLAGGMSNLNFLGGMNLNSWNNSNNHNNMPGLGFQGMGNGLGLNMMNSNPFSYVDNLFGNQVNLNPHISQNRS